MLSMCDRRLGTSLADPLDAVVPRDHLHPKLFADPLATLDKLNRQLSSAPDEPSF